MLCKGPAAELIHKMAYAEVTPFIAVCLSSVRICMS